MANGSRQDVLSAGAWPYVTAGLVTIALVIAAIVAITIARPEADNGAIIATIIGFSGTTFTGIVTALASARRGAKLNDKVNIVAEKATIAAVKSEAADVKLDEIHAKTDEATKQNEVIAKNTDGHLTKLQAELEKQADHNAALQDTINRLTVILAAQKAPTTREVRADDLKPVKVEVVKTPKDTP